MSKSNWTMRWFKMHHNFDDTGKWTAEIENEELGAWVRLLKHASKCNIRGTVQIDGGIPYTAEQLKVMIKTDKPFIKKWAEQGAIKLENGIIYIQNWELYQCEQDRKDKQTLKQTLKKTPLTDTTDLDLDLDLDIDLDKEKKKKKNLLSANADVSDIETEFLSVFNNKMPVKIAKMTESRRKTLKIRLKDEFFKDNWKKALEIVPTIPFLNGDNDRKWKADFDFFMRPDSVTKIIEGKYGKTEEQPKKWGTDY